MSYYPLAAMTADALTDNAGGTASRTIAAAGTTYDQANENNDRSSMGSAYNDLRTLVRQTVGVRGGGYRPFTSPGKSSGTPAATGTIIAAADTLYDQANENGFRGNLRQELDDMIDNLVAAGGTTGPRGSFTRLTDNSGGSTGSGLGAPSTYSQTGENNTRAQFSARINGIANGVGL